MGLLSAPDWLVIGLYFVVILGVGVWVTCQRKDKETSASYFLAGRNIGWFVIGASLFASNIGSEHLVGLAGTGAASGVAVGQFEILACFMLLTLGWVFVPFYLKSGVYTMPEFLERRYNSSARWYLAVISIVGYVLTKISVTIAAGGIVFEALMGIDFWTGALIVVVITGIYTVMGGLRVVLITEALQMFVLVGGAIAVTAVGLSKLGGWDQMVQMAGPGFMTLWKPMSDPDFPWTGILFGAPILGVWYWCTDQFIVQRVLSARSIEHARGGTIFAGFLKLLPLFIFVVPGVIAYCLTQTGAIQLDKPDHALPTLIGALLPAGIRGLVVAGLLAALMSSLSAVFNSCSTLITWDIYRKWKPHASERQLVWVGKISTSFLVILGIAWIPIIERIAGGLLYKYLQSVQAYISPPIAAVFLLGVFWKRVNSQGAITALVGGFFLGMGRLVAEIFKDSLNSPLLYAYADMNFLHFALLLFVICTAILVGVSLVTAEQSEEKLMGLTFQTVGEEVTQVMEVDRKSKKWVIAASLALVVAVGCIWLYFTG